MPKVWVPVGLAKPNPFLAISLGLFEIARLLLSSGANPTSKNSGGWSALHEAVSTGDPELVIEILGPGSIIGRVWACSDKAQRL